MTEPYGRNYHLFRVHEGHLAGSVGSPNRAGLEMLAYKLGKPAVLADPYGVVLQEWGGGR